MQILPSTSLGFMFSALVLCFCGSQRPDSANRPDFAVVSDSMPYDLKNPSLIMDLLDQNLNEISDLSPTDSQDIYLAVGDERGEAYFLDVNKGGAIRRTVKFHDKGDFEGIVLVDQTIWALKSKGDLYEITQWKNNPPSVVEHKTFLKKSNDVEGLAYDSWRKALLLACKEQPDSLYPREIYAFDLASGNLDRTPAYTINPEEVNKLVAYAPTEKHDYFSPSALAIHPITGDLYVISTALKRLVVMDYKSGKIKFAQRIDKLLLPQPEGIAFDPKGNMWISSEGKGSYGLLARFDFKEKKGTH